MTKTLASGIKVDSQQYYKLLEWKDKNMDLFCKLCAQYYGTSVNNSSYSINSMTIHAYNYFVKRSNIEGS